MHTHVKVSRTVASSSINFSLLALRQGLSQEEKLTVSARLALVIYLSLLSLPALGLEAHSHAWL